VGDSVYLWTKQNIVLGPLDPTQALDLRQALEVKCTLVLTERSLGAGSDAAPWAREPLVVTRTILTPALKNESLVMACRLLSSSSTVVLELFPVDEWASTQKAGGALRIADINSAILGWPPDSIFSEQDVSHKLVELLRRANTKFYADELAAISDRFAITPTTITADQWTDRVASLLTLRAEYAMLMVLASTLDTEHGESQAQISQAIQLMDGLNTSALIHQISVLNEEASRSRRAANRDRESAARRDRFVAIGGAVVLLPSLWFSFLGTNVFPEKLLGLSVQSVAGVYIALLGGIASIALGIALVKFIFRKTRND
jgi:hypothetical protein